MGDVNAANPVEPPAVVRRRPSGQDGSCLKVGLIVLAIGLVIVIVGVAGFAIWFSKNKAQIKAESEAMM